MMKFGSVIISGDINGVPAYLYYLNNHLEERDTLALTGEDFQADLTVLRGGPQPLVSMTCGLQPAPADREQSSPAAARLSVAEGKLRVAYQDAGMRPPYLVTLTDYVVMRGGQVVARMAE